MSERMTVTQSAAPTRPTASADAAFPGSPTSTTAPHSPGRPDSHVVYGDLVVFAGAPPEVPIEGPWVVLVHGSNSTGSPESHLLLAERLPDAAPADAGSVTGVAVPARRLKIAQLAERTALPATPLVRSSRRLLLDLASAPASASPSAALEDWLVGLFQGVVRENPGVIAGVRREGVVPQEITAMIEARHTDPAFDVAAMAQSLHISRRQLYRYAPEGVGLATLLAQRRLDTATALLAEQPNLTLATTAQLAGFRDAASMRVQFLQKFGMTPRQYRAGA